MSVEVIRIPVLSDNYVWLVRENTSGEVMVVDPAVAEPVLAKAAELGWTITHIWNTHWHPDHTGGNAEIKAALEERGGGCTITGPAAASLIIERVGGLGETWIPLHTNSPFTGSFNFTDANPGATNRFYRGRLP